MLEPLPAYDSPIIGRQNEIDTALRLLRQTDPPVRLITFTGPGGIGKTRLALQIAAEWWHSSSGKLYFVSLASVAEPAMVVPAIARALDIRDTGSQPVAESINDFLRTRNAMLLLDNFEQIRSAAPVVSDLTAASPRLKVLVTSRAPLRVAGEYEFLVPPLTIPDVDHLPSPYMLSNYASVSLFVQRAQLVDGAFALTSGNAAAIAEICTHLDGLPLAIELAAARVNSIPPHIMRDRLHSRLMLSVGGKERSPRHQSLRATIDWSYDLLSEGEKTLFARLSVFAGTCSVECAEAVCNGSGDLPISTPDGLDGLVTQNLLRTSVVGGERRYDMLETIREYALERLAERGEAAPVRRRHAAHFMQMAELAEASLRGPEQSEWLNRLDVNLDNVRAALAWSLDSGEYELGSRLAGALSWFWFVHGHTGEGREWLAKLLAMTTEDTPARTKALNAAGYLALAHSDHEAAYALYKESLFLAKQQAHRAAYADALYGLGRIAGNRSSYAEAISLYEESLAVHEALGRKLHVSDVLFSLGRVASDQADHARARSYYDDSLKIRRELGDQWGIANALTGLAFTAADLYDHTASRALSTESLTLYRELGDSNSAANMLFNLGYVAGDQGDYALAESLYRESQSIWLESGSRTHLASLYRQWCYIATAQGDLHRAQSLGEECLSLFRAAGSKRGINRALLALGAVARLQGRYDEACALIEEALAIGRELEDKHAAPLALKELGLVDLHQTRYAQAAARLKQSLQSFVQSGEKRSTAECFEGLARLAAAVGQPLHAARLWGAAGALRKLIGGPLEPVERAGYEQAAAAARAAGGDASFSAAWLEGQTMPVTQAILLALDTSAG